MLSHRLLVACALIFAVAGWVGWRVTMEILPYRVMDRTEAYLAGLAGGANVMLHARRYGPTPVEIPRANPDIMASTCVYDLSAGPVRIRGKVWDGYWSLSLYSHRSDNIFILNDRESGATFDVTIRRNATDAVAPGSLGVISPTRTGIVLVRRFVTDEGQLQDVHANQDTTICGLAGL